MMNKESAKKRKIIIMALLTVVVITVFLFVMFGGIGELGNSSDGILVYDKNGEKIATLSLKDETVSTTLINEDAREYVALATDEALEQYAKITDNEKDMLSFFSTVKSVKTNLDSDVLQNIKDGYLSSSIGEDASFASVITDIQGRVLAVYGKGSEENVVYSGRNTYAASAIKPLSVYALAVQRGKVHWSTKIMDSPVKTVTNENGQQVDWPANANGIYTGDYMLLCDAVYKSTNTVAVKILRDFSVEKSMDFLSNSLGINLAHEQKLVESKGPDEVLGNIALGYLYHGVSALDMAGYYQIFANGGYYTSPYTVASINGAEGEIFVAAPEKRRVLSEHTACIITQLLRGVLYPGATATEAYLENTDVAGKSGTSDEYADNWFVGFTPEYVCSVWHSSDNSRKNKAASTFASIMENMPVKTEHFTVSGNVKLHFYCKKTGHIRSAGCTDIASGYYYGGNVPGTCKECSK